MYVAVLGVSHRSGSLERREALSLLRTRLERRMQALRRMEFVSEWLVLDTCNRFELYVASSRSFEALDEFVRRFILDTAIESVDALMDDIYVYTQESAVRHLLRVATGLESLVLGEAQILGQVRTASVLALETGAAGPCLERLVAICLRWARKVRRFCHLGFFSVSMATAVVEVTRRIFKDMGPLVVAVVGTGKIGRLVVRSLVSEGVHKVYVVNRSVDAAQRVTHEFGGESVPLSEMGNVLRCAHVVISCTGAPHPVIRRTMVDEALSEVEGRSLLVVDLAVPRDVESSVGEHPLIELLNVDDLQDVADGGSGKRLQAVERAGEMLEGGVQEFMSWLRRDRVGPLLAAMEARIQASVNEAVEFVSRDKSSLRENVRFRQAVRRAVRRVMHPWMVGFRRLVDDEHDDARQVLESVAGMLDIGDEDDEEKESHD